MQIPATPLERLKRTIPLPFQVITGTAQMLCHAIIIHLANFTSPKHLWLKRYFSRVNVFTEWRTAGLTGPEDLTICEKPSLNITAWKKQTGGDFYCMRVAVRELQVGFALR